MIMMDGSSRMLPLVPGLLSLYVLSVTFLNQVLEFLFESLSQRELRGQGRTGRRARGRQVRARHDALDHARFRVETPGGPRSGQGVIEHVWRPGKLALLARVPYLVACARKALRR